MDDAKQFRLVRILADGGREPLLTGKAEELVFLMEAGCKLKSNNPVWELQVLDSRQHVIWSTQKGGDEDGSKRSGAGRGSD